MQRVAQPTRYALFSGPSLLEKSAFVPASRAGIPILSLGGWLFPGQAQASTRKSGYPSPMDPSAGLVDPSTSMGKASVIRNTGEQLWVVLCPVPGCEEPQGRHGALLAELGIRVPCQDEFLIRQKGYTHWRGC